MHRDCAVQTMPAGLTLVIEDDDNHHHHNDDSHHDVDAQWMARERQAAHNLKGKGVRRHLAQYGDQVSEDLALGWDCGICFETAEEPCVTRCGHLYCQAHLHHWLATHPSCPVCKTFCTPSADVVPIFSRGRASPPSSAPSSPDTPLLRTSTTAPPPPYFSPPTPAPTPPPPPPPPPDVFSLSASRAHRPTPVLPPSPYDDDEDGDDVAGLFPLSPPVPAAPSSSPTVQAAMDTDAPLSPSAPLSPIHTPHPHPHPHPLNTSHMLAHHLGLVLRVLALAILLGVLLR